MEDGPTTNGSDVISQINDVNLDHYDIIPGQYDNIPDYYFSEGDYYLYENGLLPPLQPNYVHKYEFTLFIFNLTLTVITFASNVALIFFICGQTKARTTHNLTIVSVAVSSILISAVVLPTHLALYLYNHPYDEVSPFLCKMSKYIGFWCKFVTVFSTLGMVMNRYYKAIDPCGRTFLTGRCMLYLNFVWFSGAAYNIWKIVLNASMLMPLTINSRFIENATVKWCTMSGYFPKIQLGFQCSDYIVIFGLPLLVIGYMFTSLSWYYFKTYQRGESLKSQGRILMAALFALLFFLCQLPLQIAETILEPKTSVSEMGIGIIRICESISFMQGFLNTVAYVACCKEIHHSWKRRIFGEPQTSTRCQEPTTRVLLRTTSIENVVETVCLQ